MSGPIGNGSETVVDDALVEEVLLGRLQLLRVLLGLGQRPQIGLELLAHRGLDDRGALLLEHLCERHPHLELADDVLLRRLHREPAGLALEDVGDGSGALVQAVLAKLRDDLLAVPRVDLLGHGVVEPLRLPGLRAELLLRLAELDDLALRDVERLEQRRLGHLVGARLDHRQPVLRADDDQVEPAALLPTPRASG